eukprot:c21389_g1_i1.p1 GENE.c21389_g1_i1~~c21389_g1_i1.p1  ORF type:complete len:213 (+),score=21.47 c21389_g1_i1:124-762(+)
MNMTDLDIDLVSKLYIILGYVHLVLLPIAYGSKVASGKITHIICLCFWYAIIALYFYMMGVEPYFWILLSIDVALYTVNLVNFFYKTYCLLLGNSLVFLEGFIPFLFYYIYLGQPFTPLQIHAQLDMYLYVFIYTQAQEYKYKYNKSLLLLVAVFQCLSVLDVRPEMAAVFDIIPKVITFIFYKINQNDKNENGVPVAVATLESEIKGYHQV